MLYLHLILKGFSPEEVYERFGDDLELNQSKV